MNRIFYLPAFVYLAIFAIFPFFLSIGFSSPSANLNSYVSLFSFTYFNTVLSNTLVFSFGTAIAATLLGVCLAILVDSVTRGRRLLSLLSYLPYTIPFTASALIWSTIYDPIYGPADYLLKSIGLPSLNWLGQPSLQIYSTTIVSIWSSIPLAFLITLAGLTSVPASIKEAARCDGMKMWDYYSDIGLPMARGAILTAFLMTLIIAFGNFDLPYILNGGYSYSMATFPFLVWFNIFYQNQIAQGLAAAVILTAVVSVFAILLIKVTVGGQTQKPPRFRLGLRLPNLPMKGIIYAVSAATIAFMLFPIYWMLLVAFRPQVYDFAIPPILTPSHLDSTTFVQTAAQAQPYIISTLAISVAVMAISLLLAAPAAYYVARSGRKWMLYLSVFLYSMPSVSFVFGVYFMIYKTNLLNTWVASILTYPIFTVPFAIWTLNNFYSSLPKHFEEAAMVDGYSRIRAFFRVVMPLARPGLFATALLSFIYAWHLLLFPVVLSETPFQYNFPPTGSASVTTFATLFDPQSLGSTVGANVWGQIGSSAIIVALPVMILAIFTQEYLLKGLYSGGVKG